MSMPSKLILIVFYLITISKTGSLDQTLYYGNS